MPTSVLADSRVLLPIPVLLQCSHQRCSVFSLIPVHLSAIFPCCRGIGDSYIVRMKFDLQMFCRMRIDDIVVEGGIHMDFNTYMFPIKASIFSFVHHSFTSPPLPQASVELSTVPLRALFSGPFVLKGINSMKEKLHRSLLKKATQEEQEDDFQNITLSEPRIKYVEGYCCYLEFIYGCRCCCCYPNTNNKNKKEEVGSTLACLGVVYPFPCVIIPSKGSSDSFVVQVYYKELGTSVSCSVSIMVP